MADFEIGGFTLAEVGIILALVAVGMFLVNRIPPVRKLVAGA